MKTHHLLIHICMASVLAFLSACTTPNPPHTDVSIDSVFVTADLHFYGAHYENIPQNVMSMTLLSDGLQRDSLLGISGYGTILCLSDILISPADSSLQSGSYTIDTTALSNTIFPGACFERMLSGAYLLCLGRYSRDTLLFSSGEMLVTALGGDSVMLDLSLQSDKVRYHGMYHGIVSSR